MFSLLTAGPKFQFFLQPHQFSLDLIKIAATEWFVYPYDHVLPGHLRPMITEPFTQHTAHVISCHRPTGCLFADYNA